MAHSDLLILGDEIESVLAAVSAARMGLSVRLLRFTQTPEALLGGLVTRGGLAYLDITLGLIPPLYQEFLTRAGVVRVALCPQKAHNTLHAMLEEAHVSVESYPATTVLPPAHYHPQEAHWQLMDHTATILIDATPDATMARAMGIPFRKGLQGLLPDSSPEQKFLGISPIFTVSGVSRHDLIAFEADLRNFSILPALLAEALPWHSEALRKAYLTRAVESPDDQDYIDILNPSIGVLFHQWQQRKAPFKTPYWQAKAWIDGGNIARLSSATENKPEVFSWNGMVAHVNNFETALALSAGIQQCPGFLYEAMADFETYLQKEGGFSHASITPPAQLYVRQTCIMQAKRPMSALDMLKGGVAKKYALGTFSYWLDCRGVTLNQYFDNVCLPKPVFNTGLSVCLPPSLRRHPQFAFVGRSAGYSPLGQGAGRIIQHNALLAEGLGIAVALAKHTQVKLHQVSAEDIRAILAERRVCEPDDTMHLQPKDLHDQIPADGDTQLLLNKDHALII